MKPRTNVSRRVVTVLKKPTAKFVSLVDHGANQTPFDTVKQANGVKCMARALKKVKKPKASATTTKKTEAVDDLSASGVLRLEFSKKNFKDEDAVQAYLDENNWEDCEIVEEKTKFVVKSTAYTEDDFESVREVEVPSTKGVSAFVGNLLDTAEEDEDEENSQKSSGSDDDDELEEDEENEDEDDEDEDDGENDDEVEDTTKSGAPKPLTAAEEQALDDEDEENGEDDDNSEDDDASETEDEDDEEASETEDEGSDDTADDADKAKKTVMKTCHSNKAVDQYIRKFDHYGAYLSGGMSLNEVMSDGMVDGVPPGVDEIMYALRKSVGNALKDGQDTKKSINTIASEFSEAVIAIDTVWRKLLKDGDTAQKAAAKKYFASLEADDADLQTSAKSAKGVDEKVISELVTKAVGEAIAPLNTTIEKQAKTIALLRKGVPARQSLVNEDVDEGHAVDTAKKEADDDAAYLEQRSRKGLLGSYT